MSTKTNTMTTQSLKRLAIFFLAFVVTSTSYAQEWMRSTENNQTPNFYQIQKDFNAHWDGRKVEKGKGYKQFKRWEWFWEQRTSPNGDFPEQGLAAREWQKYLQDNNIANQRTESAANWTSMGPTSSAGGYEGTGRINCIAFHPTVATTFFVGSPGGGLWKTTDSGATWTCLTDNVAMLGVTSIAIDPTNANTIYIATGDGYGNFDTKSVGVLKSTDGGLTWNTTGLSWTQSQQRVIGAMIIHPTNPQILIAATSIGLHKTINGGASWTQVNTIHMQDVKFKPTDPTTVYATSYGGTSANIYKSTNTGDTFTKITAYTTFNRINIAVSPANPLLVAALCSKASDNGFGGVYTSVNSGTSFALKYSAKNLLGWSAAGTDVGGQGWYDLSIVVSPTDANLMFTGGVNTWKSTDGGTTWAMNTAWTSGTTYNPNNVAVVHADKHFHAYHPLVAGTLFECNDGGLYRTTNSGTTWTDLTNGMAITLLYRLSTAQTDANTLLVGAQDNGCKKRSSTGVWSMATGGDGMEVIVDNTNASYMYASYAQGEIYRSTNGFSTSAYTTISANIPGGQPVGAWVTPYVMSATNSSALFIGYKDVYKTLDRGTSWTKISTSLSTTDLISLAVAPSDINTIYTASLTNIYRTINGGTAWTNVSAGLPFSTAKMSYITVHPTNSQILYVTFSGYSAGNKIFKSINGGTSWTNISGTLPNLPANCVTIDKNGNEALYAGVDGGVYYRDATMTDWVLFNQGLPNVIVNELEIQYASGKLRAATYGRGVWQSDLYSSTATAVPTITSFTPASGVVGTAVTITGTNFTGATSVKFNGTAATYTVVSATSITTSVPTGATTGTISVVTAGGTATSATAFTVTTATAVPTITSFTPASGVVGTAVTITGTNFTGATSVKFNGTAATYTVVSATSITTSVPTGATTGTISVVTAGGTATSATAFTVTTATAVPTITSFTPASGAVGTAVTITGTNFTGASAVRFNGTAATYTVVSATSITTSVPTGATTGTISVTTAGGTATSATAFTVTTATVTYCASNATSTADSRINNVTFAGINNSSATGCASYTNFTSISGSVIRSQVYTVSVTLGTCGGNYTKYGKVFIDWNKDGDFIDAGETVGTSAAISTTGAFTASVTVPATAVVGATRMRVVAVETSAAANVLSCGTYTYGETEDYTINIAAAAFARPQDETNTVANELKSSFETLVYPNPTQDVLNVEMKNLDADAKVILTNAIGQVVYETQTAKSQFTIDMSNFATGLYIMQVKTTNGESVQRVIKK